MQNISLGYPEEKSTVNELFYRKKDVYVGVYENYYRERKREVKKDKDKRRGNSVWKKYLGIEKKKKRKKKRENGKRQYKKLEKEKKETFF